MADEDRVLVLGGTGFIGRHVVAALRGAGLEVVATGREPREPGWLTFDADRDDPATLLDEVRPAAVVNAIGRTDGSTDELTRANVAPLERLLEAVAAHSARLVHLGSSAEYGHGGARPTTEDDPARPVSPYGRSKLAATELVTSASADTIVLRVFNPVGPGASAASMPGRAASLLVAAVRDGAPSIVMGDLSAERDFVDVRDVADAVTAAIRAPSVPRVVNVGRGVPMTARELVATLARAARFAGAVEEHGAGSDRSLAVDRQVADVRRAATALGWSARRGIDGAAEALVASLR